MNGNQPVHPIPEDRMNHILRYIEERGSAQIKELAQCFKVSEATVRRDLDDLSKQGLLERTHGGAILLHNHRSSFERAFNEKLQLQSVEKTAIGRRAAEFIQSGDTVILDSGTTAYRAALYMAELVGITVVTHDLYLAANVEFEESATIVVTGGTKRSGHNVLVGAEVENFLRSMRADVVFLTADAVDVDFGVSNANFLESGIKKSLITAGRKKILLADHTKFGTTAVVKVCDIDDVDVIITDKGLPAEQRAQLMKCRADIITV